MFKTFLQLLVFLEVYSQTRRYALPSGFTHSNHNFRPLTNSCLNSPLERLKPGTQCLPNWIPLSIPAAQNAERLRVHDDAQLAFSKENLYELDQNSKKAGIFGSSIQESQNALMASERQGGNLSMSAARGAGNNRHLTGVIEGTGPFFCGLRVSTEQNSLILSVFTREIGWYRCYFYGQTLLAKIAIFGSGFYQCFYQRPGRELTVRNGIGPHTCFFQGIRHTWGFITKKPQKKKELTNFFYIFGRVTYEHRPNPGQPPFATGQIIGIYNFAPKGSNRNFGLVQAYESLNLPLPPVPIIGDGSTKLQQLKQTTTTFFVNQRALYNYHYVGTDFDEGLANRFASTTFNLQRVFDSHTFLAQLFLIEFHGQGGIPLDDRDFMQGWLTYKYRLPIKTQTVAPPPFIGAFLVGQYNYLTYDTTNPRAHGLDFIQFILGFSQTWDGFNDGDVFNINYHFNLQTNSDRGVKYLAPDEDDDSPGQGQGQRPGQNPAQGQRPGQNPAQGQNDGQNPAQGQRLGQNQGQGQGRGLVRRQGPGQNQQQMLGQDQRQVQMLGQGQSQGQEVTDLDLLQDTMFTSVLHLIYNFVAKGGSVNGVLQLYLVNQYYFSDSSEEPPGFWQFTFAYFRTYKPLQRLSVNWSILSLIEYAFGNQELSNGVLKLQGQTIFDTTELFEQNINVGPFVQLNRPPSTITLHAHFQCIWFGIENFHPICFLQLYAYYVGSIVGIPPIRGTGETVLLAQFYQDIRL